MLFRSELTDLWDFGLQQPIDVPSDAQFAFTLEGEKQHERLIKLLSKASKVLQCDLERIKNSPRVSESDKTKRDILLYLLWQEGTYTNIQIGGLSGLTHSAVSRRVAITRKKWRWSQTSKGR